MMFLVTIRKSLTILKTILYADSERSAAKVKADRLGEIDLAKGIAGFLMVLSHMAGPHFLLNIGTFGAPLFFCCSGMNTYLFLKNSEKLKGSILSISSSPSFFFSADTPKSSSVTVKSIGLSPNFFNSAEFPFSPFFFGVQVKMAFSLQNV